MILETNEREVESRFMTCPKADGFPLNSIKVRGDRFGGAHTYTLSNLKERDENGNWVESKNVQEIQFFERSGDGDTTTEGIIDVQVVDMLIDRIRHMNAVFPDPKNDKAIAAFFEARSYLEKRTFERLTRKVLGKEVI